MLTSACRGICGSEPRYCWYTRDHLGSVRAVADAEGNVFASYAYGPYGEDFVAERIVGEDQVLNGAASGSSLTYQPDGGTTVLDGLTPSAEYHLKPGVTLPGTTPAVTYTANESPDWQPYKFSGKESLTRVGLELYDFGARMYSPSNMRWMTMDPLAEKYYHISPYAYCSGDPINRIDPDGCTDYFNQYGVWLYNDGVDDGRILITNEESIQEAMEICGGMDSGEDFFASLESMSLSFSSAVRNGIMDKDNAIKVYDYYNQTGLPIEESGLTKGAGFNFEDPNSVKLVVNIERGAKPHKTEDGNFEYLNDNSYNIINKLNGHEGDGHYKKWQEAGGDKKQFRQIDTEENAINAQMNHPSWSKTTKAFKENTRNYLKRVKK